MSTLSSSPGRTRLARASNSAWRAASTSGGRASSPRACMRLGMVVPCSKLPPGRKPYQWRATSASLAEDLAHLRVGPHVELALLALAVGVLGRGDAAAGLAQVAEHVVDRLGEHLPEARLAGELPAVQVEADQQRVVVEHLLEVRHQPHAVDGVAGEPAAEVVVDAAGRHGVERRGERGQGAARRRGRRPRRAPRAPSAAGTSARRRARPTPGRWPRTSRSTAASTSAAVGTPSRARRARSDRARR